MLLQKAMEKEVRDAEYDIDCLSAELEDADRLLLPISNTYATACHCSFFDVSSLYDEMSHVLCFVC